MAEAMGSADASCGRPAALRRLTREHCFWTKSANSARTAAQVAEVSQDHEFERLGSTRTQQVDVRVIAATHRDLKQMVEAGQFRSDLYDRLYAFPLLVPPLRERKEDIPMLVRHYVEKYARRMHWRPRRDLNPCYRRERAMS